MPNSLEWYQFWKLGDANLDGVIDDKDLDFIQSYVGSWHPAADINEDKSVDTLDLQIAVSNYGLNIWDYVGERKPLEWWHWILLGGGALVFIYMTAKIGAKVAKKSD